MKIIFLNIFALIIILLILNIIYIRKKENFNTDDKIVYIVWNDNIDKQGLGDKLRGTLAIIQYCRSKNIKYAFDATLSVFGKYFKNANSLNPRITVDTPIKSYVDICYENPMKSLIDEELINKDEIYVSSNLYPTFPFSNKELNFLNYITEPNKELKKKVRKLLKTLPENFTIQHFRFTDNTEPDEEKCAKCYEIFCERYEETDILMSNSKVFKDYILKKENIKIINCNDCEQLHVGLNPTSKIIEYTLIEYYILTRAKLIKTCSEYYWISGFVYWPANFYNIPIENIQI